MWTCEHKLAMGGQTDSQVDANSMQVAKKPFQCSLALGPIQTILRPTCNDLCWVAKWWKTCVHLHANLSSIKVNASHRKPSQVHTLYKSWQNGVASRRKFAASSKKAISVQVNASFQLAITCDSVWPGLKSEHKKLLGQTGQSYLSQMTKWDFLWA